MTAIGIAANKQEFLQIAKQLAEEHLIDREIVLEAVEQAIEKVAKEKYGHSNDIRAKIDPATGRQDLWRVQTVVADDEEIEEEAKVIRLTDAKGYDKTLAIGDEVKEDLPPYEPEYDGAYKFRQVLRQVVKEAERERQYDEFKGRVGEIINGIVRSTEYGNVIVDLGRADGHIRRNDGIPRENFQPGDRIQAYLYKVSREVKGPQIFLSRAAPDYMVKLFSQEVPEVYDNVIEIKACARDPGSRAKIGVISHDTSIDPVGACVGMRGARVQAVVGELFGEKIDIIPWSTNHAEFIVNALQPAEVTKVVFDEDELRVEVVVADDQFPLAIGRRGQNVRLATQLTGWQIDLITQTEYSERYQRELKDRTELFMESLDTDETFAQLLASEGFETIEEIAYVDPAHFVEIDGINEDDIPELQSRAVDYLTRLAEEQDAERKELGVEDEVMELENMTTSIAVRFGKNFIRTVEDVAGLVPDDITGYRDKDEDNKPIYREGILKKGEMRKHDAQMFIMKARVKAGWVSEDAIAELQKQLDGGDEISGELSAEEQALMALGELGADNEAPVSETDLANLEAERGHEAASQE